MAFNGRVDRFYTLSQWMIKCAYVNILWILFTLLGFVILGIMPASAAMFSIVRKWLRGDQDISVLSVFWSEYRSSFILTNLLGSILLIIGLVLYQDTIILQKIEAPLSFIFLTGLMMISIFFVILALYIIPVFVHFQLGTFQYLKYALLLGIANFHFTIFMVVCVVILFYFFNFIPSLIPFFAFSITSFVIMWFANRAFAKVHKINSPNEHLTLKQ